MKFRLKSCVALVAAVGFALLPASAERAGDGLLGRADGVLREEVRGLYGDLTSAGRWREFAVGSANGEQADIRGWLSSRWEETPGRLADRFAAGVAETAASGLREGGWVEHLDFSFALPLRGREGRLELNATGSLWTGSDGGDSALGWHLPLAIGGTDGDEADSAEVVGNLGIFYRRTLGDSGLAGLNVFGDYQDAGLDGGFWRWSAGLEYRSAWADVFANRYFAATEAKRRWLSGGRERLAYTAGGYDAEVRFHSPRSRWLEGFAAYELWEGEFGDGDDAGFRYGFRMSPETGGVVDGLRLEADYDDGGDGFGGRFSYEWLLGGRSGSGAYGAFDAGAYLYAPVERRHGQKVRVRIRRLDVEGSGAIVRTAGGCDLSGRNAANPSSSALRNLRMSLTLAAGTGNFAEACTLLGDGAPVDPSSGEDGPLHYAAAANAGDIVRLLLDADANIEAPGRSGKTPLHRAADAPNSSAQNAFNLLLDKGANPIAADSNGNQAMHYAAASNSPIIIGVLVEKGANPDAGNNENGGALHLAAHHNAVEAAMALVNATLINSAATLNVNKTRGHVVEIYPGTNITLYWTPLDYAAQRGNREVAGYLRSQGGRCSRSTLAECESQPLGISAPDILRAAQAGYEGVVATLVVSPADADYSYTLAAGGGVFTVNGEGVVQTRSRLTGGRTHVATAQVVGSKIGYLTTTLSVAISVETLESPDAVSVIVSPYAAGGFWTLAIETDNDFEFAFASAGGGNSAGLQVDEGGVLSASGMTLFGNYSLTAVATSPMLLGGGLSLTAHAHASCASGANVLFGADSRADEASMLFAVTYGRADMACYHINDGINVDLRDADGRTPLHWAAGYGHEDITDLLLTYNATLNARDERGWTPLDVGVVWHGVVGSLKEKGGVCMSEANQLRAECGLRIWPLSVAVTAAANYTGDLHTVTALVSEGLPVFESVPENSGFSLRKISHSVHAVDARAAMESGRAYAIPVTVHAGSQTLTAAVSATVLQVVPLARATIVPNQSGAFYTLSLPDFDNATFSANASSASGFAVSSNGEVSRSGYDLTDLGIHRVVADVRHNSFFGVGRITLSVSVVPIDLPTIVVPAAVAADNYSGVVATLVEVPAGKTPSYFQPSSSSTFTLITEPDAVLVSLKRTLPRGMYALTRTITFNVSGRPLERVVAIVSISAHHSDFFQRLTMTADLHAAGAAIKTREVVRHFDPIWVADSDPRHVSFVIDGVNVPAIPVAVTEDVSQRPKHVWIPQPSFSIGGKTFTWDIGWYMPGYDGIDHFRLRGDFDNATGRWVSHRFERARNFSGGVLNYTETSLVDNALSVALMVDGVEARANLTATPAPTGTRTGASTGIIRPYNFNQTVNIPAGIAHFDEIAVLVSPRVVTVTGTLEDGKISLSLSGYQMTDINVRVIVEGLDDVSLVEKD